MVIYHPHSLVFQKTSSRSAQVTVCVSLYNYADYIEETLESVGTQTLELLDLIIVDDRSQDSSLAVASAWLEKNHPRFNQALLVQHDRNSGGPSGARNTAIFLSRTPFIFPLDADNLLYPQCIARCLETIVDTNEAVTYPLIERFGVETGIMGNQLWSADILAHGNYIDNMALIRKTCLEAVGGYSYMRIYGWEDFDLWCKFVERGYRGILVQEILARYRVHPNSLLQTQSNLKCKFVTEEILQRHPWLKLEIEQVA